MLSTVVRVPTTKGLPIMISGVDGEEVLEGPS
jgi:hypothetical protein